MYKENSLNKMLAAIGVAAALSLGSASVYAQAQRSHIVGVTKDDQKLLATGWSLKKDIMDKAVYNDNDEKIGSVDDLIVSRNKSLSYAIIGVGGFLGMGTHDVAIPVNHIKEQDNLRSSRSQATFSIEATTEWAKGTAWWVGAAYNLVRMAKLAA